MAMTTHAHKPNWICGDVDKNSKMAPTLTDAVHSPFSALFYTWKRPCPKAPLEACCVTSQSQKSVNVCVTYACDSVVETFLVRNDSVSVRIS